MLIYLEKHLQIRILLIKFLVLFFFGKVTNVKEKKQIGSYLRGTKSVYLCTK